MFKKIFDSKKIRKKPKNPSFGREKYKPNAKGVSKLEKEVWEFIKQNTEERVFVSNRSILRSKEIDILIPKLKLAIEFNGDYWHSTKHKQYWEHLHKTKNCEAKGIRLIQIWEDEWKNNRLYVEYVLLCYLNNNTPIINGELLNRDYFSKLDFPGAEEVKPSLTQSGGYEVVKTGFLKI